MYILHFYKLSFCALFTTICLPRIFDYRYAAGFLKRNLRENIIFSLVPVAAISGKAMPRIQLLTPELVVRESTAAVKE